MQHKTVQVELHKSLTATANGFEKNPHHELKVIVLASKPKNKINHELIYLLCDIIRSWLLINLSAGKVTVTVNISDKPAAMKKPVQWWNGESQASC